MCHALTHARLYAAAAIATLTHSRRWLGFGEIWSARLMHAYLNLLDAQAEAASKEAGGAVPYVKQQALFVDARDIVQLTSQHKDPTPDYVLSKAKLDAVSGGGEGERRGAMRTGG